MYSVPVLPLKLCLQIALLLLLLGSPVAAEEPIVDPTNRAEARAALIPYPRVAKWASGSFSGPTVALSYRGFARGELRARDVAELSQVLRKGGFAPEAASTSPVARKITIRKGAIPQATKQSEAYKIEVSPQAITITTWTSTGLFYAAQTVRQLIDPKQPSIPCCTIVDWPAFPIRGFMHDLGRNPQSVALLKRFLDTMARY